VSGEILSSMIASVHNLGFYMWLVKEARRRITDGTFYEWKNIMVKKLEKEIISL